MAYLRPLLFYPLEGILITLFSLTVPVSSDPNPEFMTEICSNQVDDDGDGLIDIFDPECQCHENYVLNGHFEAVDSCCANITSQYNTDCIQNWTILQGSTELFTKTCENLEAFFDPDLLLENGNVLGMALSKFDENSAIGAESMGNCLSKPLLPGELYTLTLDVAITNRFKSNSGQLRLYGLTSCDQLIHGFKVPYGQDDFFCNSPFYTSAAQWISIDLDNFPLQEWQSFKYSFSPEDTIEAVMLYADCTTNRNFLDYIIVDNIHITPAIFEEGLAPNMICNPFEQVYFLECQLDSVQYQWYKDSLPIPGANQSILPLQYQDQGFYHVAVNKGERCQLSEPIFITAPIIIEQQDTFCSGEIYLFNNLEIRYPGNYLDRYHQTCDTLINLFLASNGTTIYDTLFYAWQAGDTISLFDKIFFQPGIFSVHRGSSGCDSTFIIVIADNLEICDNYQDDDGDGLIDAFDPDCRCEENLVSNAGFETVDSCCSGMGPNYLTDCLKDWVILESSVDLFTPTCKFLQHRPTLNSLMNQQNVVAFGLGKDPIKNIIPTTESIGSCLNNKMYPGIPYAISLDLALLIRRNQRSGIVMMYGLDNCDKLVPGYNVPY